MSAERLLRRAAGPEISNDALLRAVRHELLDLVEAVEEHRRERSHHLTANMTYADRQLDEAFDRLDERAAAVLSSGRFASHSNESAKSLRKEGKA